MGPSSLTTDSDDSIGMAILPGLIYCVDRRAIYLAQARGKVYRQKIADQIRCDILCHVPPHYTAVFFN